MSEIADVMANSVDSDETAPICSGPSIRIFRVSILFP